jgi:hypothetical protein
LGLENSEQEPTKGNNVDVPEAMDQEFIIISKSFPNSKNAGSYQKKQEI